MTKKKLKCPRCESGHIVKHGFKVNISGKIQRVKCQDCGHTFYEDKEGKE